MSSKVLFLTDLHKRDVDFSSIEGYTKAVTQVQMDLLEFIKNNGITHVVSGGDWYDRGYKNTGPTLSDNELDRRFSESVNGEFYITIGNHFNLERDNNPESYVIQPCEKYPLIRSVITPERPIFKCVDELIIGDIQISFMHFNKMNKTYVNTRKPGIKMHIGVYHDDCVVPSDIREQSGYFGKTSSKYLDMIYDNIDIAIINHIHVACGRRILKLSNGRSVPLLIPGSLGITQNKEIEKHKLVELPILEIADDGAVGISFHKQLTHLDMLKFYKKKETTNMASNLVNNLNLESVSKMTSLPKSRTLKDYLVGRGYNSSYLDVVKKAVPGGLDTMTVYKELFGNKEDVENESHNIDE